MATDLGVTLIAQQGDMLDLMVRRHYGRQDGRRVEIVLDHPKKLRPTPPYPPGSASISLTSLLLWLSCGSPA